jgi:hypothetical protein
MDTLQDLLSSYLICNALSPSFLDIVALLIGFTILAHNINPEAPSLAESKLDNGYVYDLYIRRAAPFLGMPSGAIGTMSVNV